MAFPFEPAASNFSIKNALGSALASQLAYSDPAAIEAKAKGDWGFASVKHYATSSGSLIDTQGFLAARSDMALFAFRGTEPEKIQDWLTDAEALLVPTPMGHLHHGFWSAFKTAEAAILNDLKTDPGIQGKPLWITGHSLGAALSTILSLSCSMAGLKVAGHYNFGSPRVGDTSFRNFYNERCAAVTFRFVNNNDIVPRVPPREFLYTHVDFKRYLDSHCNLVTDTRMVDLLLDSFEGTMLGLRKVFGQLGYIRKQNLPWPDFIEDHFIQSYINCIQKSQAAVAQNSLTD